MKKKQVLLKVSYHDNSGKYWSDSFIKNKVFDLIDNNIHKTIMQAVKDTDGMELSYNGKPQANIFIDTVDGDTKRIGYIYRGKQDIQNDKTNKYEKGLFDVWVDIKEVSDFPIEALNN